MTSGYACTYIDIFHNANGEYGVGKKHGRKNVAGILPTELNVSNR